MLLLLWQMHGAHAIGCGLYRGILPVQLKCGLYQRLYSTGVVHVCSSQPDRIEAEVIYTVTRVCQLHEYVNTVLLGLETGHKRLLRCGCC